MIKAYISGKIGKDQEVISDTYLRMSALSLNLNMKGMQVFNPFSFNTALNMSDEDPRFKNGHFNRSLAYKYDVYAIMDCDRVYALNNWTDSPGAIGEIMLAINLGKDIFIGDDEDLTFKHIDNEKFMKRFMCILGLVDK